MTLRPALFAPQGGTSFRLLQDVRLSQDLAPVFRLAKFVANYAEKLQGVHLDVATLAALDEGAWKGRIDAHRRRITQWHESAAAASFRFPGAGVVWQRWLDAKGVLGKLVRLLQADRQADIPHVREIADLLGNRKAVRSLVEDTDRKAIKGHGASFSGSALDQLANRLREPRDLALEWLRIMETRPGGTRFIETTLEQLHRELVRHAPAALKAIRGMLQAGPNESLEGALQCAADAVDSLVQLFQRGVELEPDIVSEPLQALSDDLLFVTALRIDDKGALDDSVVPRDALARLIDNDSHAHTPAEAFDARLKAGDLNGANRVCERMEREEDDAADDARERFTRALEETRRHLRRQLYKLQEQLERTFVKGEVSIDSQDDPAELTARIGELLPRLEDATEPDLTITNDVAAVEDTIRSAVARRAAKIWEAIKEYLPRVDARDRALIEEAHRASDVATLHEHLDCLGNGQPLRSPDADEPSRLHPFLAAAKEINDDAGPVHDTLVQAVKQRQDILGLPFSTLTQAEAERSAKLLECWFDMAQRRSPDTERLARFFEGLGFTLAPGAVELRPDTTATLRVVPLRDRALCPIQAFGSDANGRYYLVFNWTAPARERILQAVSTADPNAHTIVMHFGKLPWADRDWLRRWSIEHPTQRFITIDETLVLYLASLPGSPLRPMFECTLPFTSAEPFFTTAGLMPPEAFFGRENERADITRPDGSYFLYGGRQLGKTALLHATRAAFHNPAAHRIAEYIDLRYEDVGRAYGADQLWQVLWREFDKLDIIPPGTPKPGGRVRLSNAIATAVADWLDAHKDRRILLLLDEADDFLRADLNDDFPVSIRLKGLMDETERRFKIVLCGLHNVLRNTERANHPLAHLGQPVCVGPLLSNGDLEQSRALVREPLAAVGYSFQSENLITQILLRTNYYPSLIQIYGDELLRHLRQAPGRNFPQVVTYDDIQAAFQRDQLRERIRGRFSLTLQLDERYEIIAYAMASELLDGPDGLSRDLADNAVFELAREYWPEGFRIPKREFGTLLHEMCVYGI